MVNTNTKRPTEPKRELVIKLYTASLAGEPKPSSEIEELHWMSKEEYDEKKYNIAYQIQDFIVPRLIKDKLVY